MFRKILIANRGEIAVRILRTARRMDLRTVAVFSEEDARALHVEAADEAVCIGPAPAAQSYLDVQAILEAVRRTGAEAVHPGYGFLSENASLAQALEAEGVAFIGPGPEAIRVMGDKVVSKRIATEAGVSTVPGHPEVLHGAEEAVEAARVLGYPVMIKAAAGGGGKGMRVARTDHEVREGFALASSEARASFADGRVFVERFIEDPRHIEIQILADAFGHVIHLGERECSIQRRHQKVLEESPSPFLDPETRAFMGSQAVALARAVGYRSAGTVEFIVDQDRRFYFLEMNTRLQVEHPVTEMVTGLDLVEQMIRIAAGEPLALRQEDVRRDGWAMECRIYAEDPFKGFVPSTGRLVRFLPPPEDADVRVDSGVLEGKTISRFYDPMIAKLVTRGRDRTEAADRMRRALDEFYIEGVEHNVPFLSALLVHPRFRRGELSTAFLTEEYPNGFTARDVPADDPHLLTIVAATAHVIRERRKAGISGQLPGHEMVVGEDWIVQVNDAQHAVRVRSVACGWEVHLHGELQQLCTDWQPGQPVFRAELRGERHSVQIQRRGIGYRLFHAGAVAEVKVLAPRAAELYGHMPVKRPPDLSGFLLSPMPGQLLALFAEEGRAVRAGEMLAIVEAMKMENVLRAARDGVVAKILARPGDTLRVGQPILELEAVPAGD